MAAPSISALWARGVDIVSSIRDSVSGALRVSLGNAISPFQAADDAEWWQHTGWASLPPDPAPGERAAQAFVVNGPVRSVIASRDARCNQIYGQLKAGEFCCYAPGADARGQARILGKQDGSLTLYTRRGNAEDGAGMAVILDAQGGGIQLVAPNGAAIILNDDGITLTAGGSSLTLGSDGAVKLIGTGQTQVDGGTVVIGSQAVPIANAALKGPAGIIAVPSLKVLIE